MGRSFKQAEQLNGPIAFLIEKGPNCKYCPLRILTDTQVYSEKLAHFLVTFGLTKNRGRD